MSEQRTRGAGVAALPQHAFKIGNDGYACIGQLPNFRPMVSYVVGKAPLFDGDGVGGGPTVLGSFIADAALKFLRPWPVTDGAQFKSDPAQSLLADIEARLRPTPPVGELARDAFFCRIGEFMQIAVNRPCMLTDLAASIDRLTNERLTERAAAILATGIDPGADDLWPADAYRESGKGQSHEQ